jgi:predicted kinase
MNDNKPVVFLAVGCPGSGKSTWWKDQLAKGFIPASSFRINMDEIRKELTGNESDQTRNYAVSKIAEVKLKAALSERIPVIYWDNTSTQAKYRKNVISLAQAAGYKVVCVFWNLPLAVCKMRNNSRDRVVPEDVIEKMHNAITSNPPKLEEGFSEIITFSMV